MNVQEILSQRAKTHGSYDDNAHISEEIMRVLAKGSSFTKLTDVQLNALRMIAMKMSRICSGDPNEKDSWLDCAGFATLAADRIQITHPELPINPDSGLDPYQVQPGLFQRPPIPPGWRQMESKELVSEHTRTLNDLGAWEPVCPAWFGDTVGSHWSLNYGTIITPDWHNPCNVESPGEGYRFLLEGEKRKPYMDVWSGSTWSAASTYPDEPLHNDKTYRTKCPLPTIA